MTKSLLQFKGRQMSRQCLLLTFRNTLTPPVTPDSISKYYKLLLLFIFSIQNDHLATDRQAEGPAEQSPRVPPEIHPAVLLKSLSQKKDLKPTHDKKQKPIKVDPFLTSAFSAMWLALLECEPPSL